MIKNVFYFFFLISIAINLYAGKLQQLDNVVDIGDDISYLNTDKKYFQDILQQKPETEHNKLLSKTGFNWYRYDFTFEGYDAREFVLECSKASLSEISFYFLNNNDSLLRFCSVGNIYGHNLRDLNSQNFSFKFKPEPENQYKLIVKIKNKTDSKIKFKIYSLDYFLEKEGDVAKINASFIIFLILFLLLTGGFWMGYKASSLPYLFLFSSLSFALFLLERGNLYEIIPWLSLHDFQIQKFVLNPLLIFLASNFIAETINFKSEKDVFNNRIYWLVLGTAFLTLLAYFMDESIAFSISNISMFFSGFGLIRKFYLQTQKPKLIYGLLLASFAPFLSIILIKENIPFLFDNIYEIGTSIQLMIFFTVFLIKNKLDEQQKIEAEIELLRQKYSKEPDTDEKYKNSKYSPEEINTNYENLIKYIDSHQPYLNSELSLQKLAMSLNISAHLLSQIINQKEGKNFFDFINYYRIEEAKRLLSDSKYNHHSVEGIGYDCGFNTKATFYSTFKKHVGATPADYKKRHQNP